jgi:GcrA cell cycle regulator
LSITGKKNAATANWTDERMQQLTDLWRAGLSCSMIAREMGQGLTRNAVIGKVHRMGLPGRATVIQLSAGQPRKQRAEESKPRFTKRRRIALGLPAGLPPLKVSLQKPQGEAWEAIPGVVPVSMIDLEAGRCKWPVGRETPFLFCGAPATHRHYCDHHHAWSVGQGTLSERGAIKAAKHQTNLERFVPEHEAA